MSRRKHNLVGMRSSTFTEFEAFVAVADAGSFIGGARTLGVSASAMSQIIRRLEARTGAQLFRRTTRRISTTEDGERLLARLRRAFEEIDTGVRELEERRATPAGTVRVVTPRVAYRDILEPLLPDFCQSFPNVTLDIRVDEALADLVGGGFDVGFRLGEYLEPETIAFPVGPSLRKVAFASPAYIAAYGTPLHPRDLIGHRCIGWRAKADEQPYVWEFAKDDEEVRVAVKGALVLNERELAADAALLGLGIALWVEHRICDWIEEGRIVPLLEDWCPPYPGFYAYYYRDRHMSSATRAFVSALRAQPR